MLLVSGRLQGNESSGKPGNEDTDAFNDHNSISFGLNHPRAGRILNLGTPVEYTRHARKFERWRFDSDDEHSFDYCAMDAACLILSCASSAMFATSPNGKMTDSDY